MTDISHVKQRPISVTIISFSSISSISSIKFSTPLFTDFFDILCSNQIYTSSNMKLLTIFGSDLAFASGVIATPIAANVAAQHYENSLPTAINIDNAAQSANKHALNEIGVDGAANRTRSSRDNWAGGVLGVDLKAVTGTFVVPSIAMPPGVAPEPQQGMSVWVGTHGDECPGRTILQTGVNLDMADGRARYSAWFE